MDQLAYVAILWPLYSFISRAMPSRAVVVPVSEVVEVQSDTSEGAVSVSSAPPPHQPSSSNFHGGTGAHCCPLPRHLDQMLAETVSDLLSRVETLEGRLDALVDADPACPKPRDPHLEVTTEQGGKVDVCELSHSIWDACVLTGTGSVGHAESCVLLLLFVLNLVLQLTFLWIVYSSMLVDPVGSAALDGLLRFRLGVAHSASYADPVGHTSMISKVCGEDGALHTSAGQARLYSEARVFARDGMGLCFLAQTVWFVTVMTELNEALRFALAALRSFGRRNPDTSGWRGR